MLKKIKKKNWLSPKGYIHFTNKFDMSDEKSYKFLTSLVKSPTSVAKHSFYPLIHRKLISRRYKKIGISNNGKVIRAHSKLDKDGKTISNAKERHVYYSTHIDAIVYAYYTQEILSPLYEKAILELDGLTDCISAYRKIPIGNGIVGNKNNIHFADDVFKYIKTKNKCTVLTFDISTFFDSLNHKYLKKRWCKLLNGLTLPLDHYNIYKSLTNFSYVEFYRVLKEFGIKSAQKLRKKNIATFCNTPSIFKERVMKKGYIKLHPFKDSDDVKCGIPQGTPISAFLSNLYLLEFDQEVFNFVNQKEFGIYRRYSDDIVIVCDSNDAFEIQEYILQIIKEKYKLIINSDKVSRSNFKTDSNGILYCDIPLMYLGFSFDGQRAFIKSASLAKFYRQMRLSVQSNAAKAKHSKKEKGEKSMNSMIHKAKLFKKYSHLGAKGSKKNFVIYASQASTIMSEIAIKRQLSQAWVNLNDEIEKYEIKYKLKILDPSK
jgi:hypothetical protein